MALFSATKPDHPMANIKQAKKLISELPANDALKAIAEATFWFESLRSTEGFKLEYLYELVDLLDQATKISQRRISQEYRSIARQDKLREQNLWHTMVEFWKNLGGTYVHCVEQSQAGMSGAGTLKKELPILIGRALRALTTQLKCILLRYGPIDARIWGELGKLYLLAETKGVASAGVEFYSGVQGRSTVQQEFLKALMLSVSSTDGLTPIKQQIAERTVAHFGGLYALQTEAGPGCNYFFDLTVAEPAGNAHQKFELRPTLRFFGAGPALPALHQLVTEIKTNNSVPADFNLGATYDTELVISVLQHLAMYWSDHRPERRSERRRIATRLTVVHGFRTLLLCVNPSTGSDDSLDFQVPTGSESWIIENVSEGGVSAIIPLLKGDWLTIGSLLGVRTVNARDWGVCVARRITHNEQEQLRVGIRLLSNTVIPVHLAPDETASSLNPLREGEPALLLSTTPNAEGEISLLLRESGFSSGQPLSMTVRGKEYHLGAGSLIEGSDDFDWAKFKILQK